MKSFFFCTTILLFYFGGCTSTSKKQDLKPTDFLPPQNVTYSDTGPEEEIRRLKKILEKPEKIEQRWWAEYRLASIWSNKESGLACAGFLTLASEASFPLREVAELRAQQSCPANKPGLPKPDFKAKVYSPWLRELVLDVRLKSAREQKDLREEININLEYSNTNRPFKDKVAWAKKATELAQQLGDSALQQQASIRLAKLAPRFTTDPKPEDELKIAQDYKSARDFKAAREHFEKVVNLEGRDDNEKLRALEGIRHTYKLEKSTENFLLYAKKVAVFTEGKFNAPGTKKAWLSSYHDVHISWARTLWTDGQTEEAEKVLEALDKSLPKSFARTEIVLLRARIAEEKSDLPTVDKLLTSLAGAKLKTLDIDTQAKILWFQAWTHLKMQKLTDSEKELLQLIGLKETNFKTYRDHYWLGRVYKADKKTDLAMGEFKWLIENDPLGYYGLLSYRELGQELPALNFRPNNPVTAPVTAAAGAAAGATAAAPTAPTTAAADPSTAAIAKTEAAATTNAAAAVTAATTIAGSSAQPAVLPAKSAKTQTLALFESSGDQTYFDWLAAAGEQEIALKFLDQRNTIPASKWRNDSTAALTLFRAYTKIGQYMNVFGRMTEVSAEVRSQVFSQDPQLVFPEPYQEIVVQNSQRTNLPSELIYAIMRQESSFNRFARSPADAFGLLQLIPEAAHRAEKTSGITLTSVEELYEPSTNIPLGSSFMRELLDLNNHEFVTTVASYNASEMAVDRWLKTRYHDDTTAFIEEIPYEETRTYVKLVMRNFIFYMRLHAMSSSIPFPEWCLVPLHQHRS